MDDPGRGRDEPDRNPGGILVANKLTTYRIEQLERKVSEHNKVVERTYKLEGRMTEAEHDIRDLKGAA